MEWRETVNYSDENPAYGPRTAAERRSRNALGAPASTATAERSRSLACLYLGPGGQRCDQAALEGGFCPAHSRGEAEQGPSWLSLAKRAAAVIATLALVWPILADIVRELLRLLK
jgi:hypothetical protein